jgi:hypothetical protein
MGSDFENFSNFSKKIAFLLLYLIKGSESEMVSELVRFLKRQA